MSEFQRLEEAGVMEKTPKTASWWSRLSKRSKVLLAAGLAIIVLAIALGVGLGVGLNHGEDEGNDNSSSSPTSTSAPLPPTNASIWQPKVEATWQIVLLNPLQIDSSSPSITPDVDVYDIDLFDNPKATIDALHTLGKKVICYFSAGSYESGRPDSSEFQDADKGKELDGWPGEYWLQLNSSNVRSIMGKRLELAASKGCDGVDPDNVDGFDNDNGLDLTEDSSISFISFLANKAASLNLSIGLKNAAAIIPSVLPAIQFSVNEQCVENDECAEFSGFVNASKPVFHIEYPKEKAGQKVASQVCGDTGAAEGSQGFSTVKKNLNLDGWVEYCNGTTFDTSTTVKAS
ncbi:hypothetical protein FKW77_000852 [Venturia effusa]|uniref:alpha-galactosidase n=1 Tax=Venturia effusa TaxID=50376 RepID=A0A517LQJ6_9PEZI|nr:hypothetical protein FKW77_000852 [Venturia effusa]